MSWNNFRTLIKSNIPFEWLNSQAVAVGILGLLCAIMIILIAQKILKINKMRSDWRKLFNDLFQLVESDLKPHDDDT